MMLKFGREHMQWLLCQTFYCTGIVWKAPAKAHGETIGLRGTTNDGINIVEVQMHVINQCLLSVLQICDKCTKNLQIALISYYVHVR